MEIERAIEVLTPGTRFSPPEYEEALAISRRVLQLVASLPLVAPKDIQPFSADEWEQYKNSIDLMATKTGYHITDFMGGYGINVEDKDEKK